MLSKLNLFQNFFQKKPHYHDTFMDNAVFNLSIVTYKGN